MSDSPTVVPSSAALSVLEDGMQVLAELAAVMERDWNGPWDARQRKYFYTQVVDLYKELRRRRNEIIVDIATMER